MGIAKRGYITRIIEVVLFAPVGAARAVVSLLQFAQGFENNRSECGPCWDQSRL